MKIGNLGISGVPPMQTRRVSLRALQATDMPTLYSMTIEYDVLWRWRFSGTIPNYETFVKSVMNGSLANYCIVSTGNEKIMGLLSSYNADLRNGTVFVAVVMGRKHFFTGSGIEAIALFINYLFNVWPLRKVYFESVEFDYQTFSSGEGKYFKKEAHFKEFYYFGGRYWDDVICTISREEWMNNSNVQRFLSKVAVL